VYFRKEQRWYIVNTQIDVSNKEKQKNGTQMNGSICHIYIYIHYSKQ